MTSQGHLIIEQTCTNLNAVSNERDIFFENKALNHNLMIEYPYLSYLYNIILNLNEKLHT